MDKITQLQKLLENNDKRTKFGERLCNTEIVLFSRSDLEFGVGLYDNLEANSEQLDEEDCVYGNSLEETIDKAIKRWS